MNPGSTGRASSATPIPSDWEHAKTLMALAFQKDRKKPKLLALRIFLMPALLMLYTMGFFIGYRGNDVGSYVAGDYRLFEGEEWSYPEKVKMGAFDATFLDRVTPALSGRKIDIERLNATTSEEVIEMCQGSISDLASDEICAFIASENAYNLYYGGKETASPVQAALAGAQHAINAALLDAADLEEAYPARRIQQAPQLLTKESVAPDVAVVLVPSVMYVLTACMCSIFVAGVVTNEHINGISKSYLAVGVKLRTYLLQWLAYFSLNGIVLAALLTLVCVFFKLMPMSNGFLIFVSNYLGLIQLYAALILTMQFVNEEEMASALIWLVGFFSMGTGAAIIVLQSANHAALTALTVIFPFIGMMQYFGIYITYDYTGFGTGIHPGMNVASSGLLSNLIAQICGISFWVMLLLLYSSAGVKKTLRKMLGSKAEQVSPSLSGDESGTFEPLSSDKEVVLSLSGVHHTYYPPKFSCNKNAEPVQVLKGLSMDICRNEVFGYLGHNGSGKSTSIKLLAADLELGGGGVVTYHFRDGDARLGESSGDERIRTKIGVCPQHNDSLQDELTCRETLHLFAKLKGGLPMMEGQTPEDALAAEVERRLLDVKFTSEEDCDKPVGTFSGGMKRKVLIAISLLGDPEVVLMDEPTAGLDPYNRRLIWDMIISAKQGRSIVLTTHFLDEADILSDRIGIIKNGKLVTCGSSLFLKHTLGAGYTVKFNLAQPFDVQALIRDAVLVSGGSSDDRQHWSLKFGAEKLFPDLLLALSRNGATNISLDLTTLEDVFVQTGREDFDEIDEDVENKDDIEVPEDPAASDIEMANSKEEDQARIWEERAIITPVTVAKRLKLVEHFVRTNAFKMKGAIALNIAMPLIYMIVGLVIMSIIPIPITGETIFNAPIPVSSPWISARFFGVKDANEKLIHPLQPIAEPESLEDYFDGLPPPIIGGIFVQNSTLQYAPEVNEFSLQFGTSVLANYSSPDGIVTAVQQLPYVLDSPFRFDVLFLPMVLSYGFAGLAFTVLDVLLLKGNGIIELFRVCGITEWQTNLGAAAYKLNCTFLPFFTAALVLCFSLKSVLVGNGGRWLGTILIMLGYAFSGTPVGLILAKKFVHGDFKETANWFPGIYYTLVALPYVAWSSALQAVPSSEKTILIIGDVLCIVPFFAFQRGLGGVIGISTQFNDPDLSWKEVWSFDQRIWFTVLMMFLVGAMEWRYLYKLTSTRAPRTNISKEEAMEFGNPKESQNPDILEERGRSNRDDDGINARDIVKVFVTETKPKRRGLGSNKVKQKVVKHAVKGVSFGIRKNEVYTLLGPNGAGKSTLMNVLASQLTPEHGTIALCGKVLAEGDARCDGLYQNGNVAFCPQFDALFPKKTVDEHIKFYASIRGLDWNNEATQHHLNAIVKLLGLGKHRTKQSTELSGGYKRRLCLATAMIGYPNAMMLDECTTGLDPSARQLVWDALKPGCEKTYDIPAILLSSHYMDECQHLGTRIGIMIDGGLVATGSLSRLQELYCDGLFIEISFNSDADCEKSEGLTLDAFSLLNMNASVYEALPFYLKLKVTYQQDEESITHLAEAFRLLETRKVELGIQFYSIAVMNLEQIFITLSRKQFENQQGRESENL